MYVHVVDVSHNMLLLTKLYPSCSVFKELYEDLSVINKHLESIKWNDETFSNIFTVQYIFLSQRETPCLSAVFRTGIDSGFELESSQAEQSSI